MRIAVVSLAVVVLLVVACTSPPAGEGEGEGGEGEGEAAPEVAFYVGTVTTTDPDTGASFGPAKDTAVSRTIDPVAHTIVEEVLDGADTIITTMSQRENSNVFDASDDGATFSGTLTFTGAPFHFTGWSYDLSLTDLSGTIEGSATIDDEGIATDKVFKDAGGVAQARIQDALAAVDEATYDREHDRLAP
jgi:hypothetical protein